MTLCRSLDFQVSTIYSRIWTAVSGFVFVSVVIRKLEWPQVKVSVKEVNLDSIFHSSPLCFHSLASSLLLILFWKQWMFPFIEIHCVCLSACKELVPAKQRSLRGIFLGKHGFWGAKIAGGLEKEFWSADEISDHSVSLPPSSSMQHSLAIKLHTHSHGPTAHLQLESCGEL